MPEVAGNAALYINPFEANELAEAIIELQSNKNKQQELIQNGQNRVGQFTWKTNALQTIDIYNQYSSIK